MADGFLLSDAEIMHRPACGTGIGMPHIKQRRLQELQLSAHPGLYVGQCVPFYFCPRSAMLYLIHKGNEPGLAYKGGQEPIARLEADLYDTVAWAKNNQRRWAFTTSNAGAYVFDDFRDLTQLDRIDWEAVAASDWRGTRKIGKQAECLIERSFSWHLIERIVVKSQQCYNRVLQIFSNTPQGTHRPTVKVLPAWYYRVKNND